MKKTLTLALLASTVLTSAQAGDNTANLNSLANDSTIKSFLGENNVPEWLSRTEFDVSLGLGKPEFGILTVQPIIQTADKKHTVFVQGSAFQKVKFKQNRLTTNLGMGYRNLSLNDSLLLGANLFLDKDWEHDHLRGSLGLEARSSAIETNINFYDALSGKRTMAYGITERALSGWDAEVGIQVPYVPWAKMYASAYEWDGKAGSDVHGQRYSMRLQPTNWVEIEAGRDNPTNGGVANYAKLAIKIPFGGREKANLHPEGGWVSNNFFDFTGSMKNKTLEKVRRQNDITVERTTGTGGSMTVSVSRGT